MAPDCERCDDGVIDGDIETVPCPNCRDVCQWCNSEYDDGEELGDTGLVVCRPCIRDMAAYKERVALQLFVSSGFNDYLDDPGAFRESIDDALEAAVAEYDGEIDLSGGWMLRNGAEEGA